MQALLKHYKIITILFIGWFLSYVDRFLINIALPLIGKDYHLSAASQGLMLSVFFAGYALVQVPGGWLSDRIGSRKVMVFSVLMLSVFTALTGLAWSVASLLVIRFLFGVAEGGFPTASFRALSEYFPATDRSKIQSVLLSSNPLALVIAPLVAAPLIYWLDWRRMFMIVSAMGILATVLYARGLGRPTQPSSAAQAPGRHGPLISVLRDPVVWKICVVNFGLNVLIWGFLSWLPSYLLRVRHLDLLHVGVFSSLPGIAGIAGMLIGGWLADSYFAYREKYLLMITVGLAALCLLAMINASSLSAVIVCQLIIAFSLKVAFIAIWSMPLKFENTGATGSTAGVINMGSQLAGVVSPAIMGFLISAYGGSYTGAFVFLIACAVLCIVVSMTMRGASQRNYPASIEQQTQPH
ncbi:MAG: MFS transporter [Burkholderiales bacterium]|nr:MFS transporter [Burkholderiales bacterium]